MQKPRALLVAAVILAALLASPALAQERVLGLLALPGVFGEGPCKPFEPASPTLYHDAGATRVLGIIQVDQMWSFAPHGGCEGLEVSVHEGAARSELPTREYDYEAPGAIVLDRRGGMFKIRLSGGRSAWVMSPAERFMSYESLLEEFVGVTFFTDAYEGALRPAPGATVANQPTVVGKPGQPARVIETRRIADRLWLRVEVLSHSVCTAAAGGPPETVGEGWLPAHAANGEPAVWFASRGC
jgi:hypothetical protein